MFTLWSEKFQVKSDSIQVVGLYLNCSSLPQGEQLSSTPYFCTITHCPCPRPTDTSYNLLKYIPSPPTAFWFYTTSSKLPVLSPDFIQRASFFYICNLHRVTKENFWKYQSDYASCLKPSNDICSHTPWSHSQADKSHWNSATPSHPSLPVPCPKGPWALTLTLFPPF
jgi:hypothetical protein